MGDGARREFFASLESLRGLAALVVVLFHIPAWNEAFFEATFVRNGYLMVVMFFVLSGFVLSHSYGGAIGSAHDLRRFMLLRFGRLYPVHLAFLLAFLAVEVAKYVASEGMGVRAVNAQAFAQNTPAAFVEHLFLLQGLGFTEHAITFNAPAWSISTEFYTYLLFGFGVMLLPRGGFRALCAALVAAALAWIVVWPETIGYFDGIVWCVAGFFLGVLLHAVYLRTRDRPSWRFADLAVALALVAFLAVRPRAAPIDDVPMLVLSALLVMALARGGGPVDALLRRRPFAWLGERSYSLYMAHYLVIWLGSQVLRFAFNAPNVLVDGKLHARLPWELALIAYPAVIAATLLAAAVSYRFIEAPSRLWARRLAGAPEGRAAAGAATPAAAGVLPPG